jgi:hypothetical protein
MRARLSTTPPCPNCRQPLQGTLVGAAPPTEPEPAAETEDRPQIVGKHERLVLLLRDQDASKRFLVFSSHNLAYISACLSDEGIDTHTLQGHPTTIERTIADFNAGRSRVLLINAQSYGAGLNLQATTDLIVVHKMNHALSTQVIGRAQRPGRVGRLRVHSLIHEGETE